MERSGDAAASRSLDGKANKASRWGWSPASTTSNPRASNPSLGAASSMKEKEDLELVKPEMEPTSEESPGEKVLPRAKKDRSIAASTSRQSLQTQRGAEEALLPTSKPKAALKATATNSKTVQEEPEVRINIIVDPDTGATVGTVTLLDSGSTRPNSRVARELGSDHEASWNFPTAADEGVAASEEPRTGDVTSGLVRQEGALSTGSQNEALDNGEDIASDEQLAAQNTAPGSLPADLYQDLTPREAAAEHKRLENWINWTVITGRDPATWRQKAIIAKQMAARSRVLQRRALVYSQRVKDVVLAREGHHATHESFEQLKVK